MKRGDEVYFISKGVVRSGVIESQDGNTVKILYTHGKYEKRYTFKKNEIATEIEGGLHGKDRLGVIGKSSSNEGVARCDKSDSGLLFSRVSDSGREEEGKRVFKGAWQICNLA